VGLLAKYSTLLTEVVLPNATVDDDDQTRDATRAIVRLAAPAEVDFVDELIRTRSLAKEAGGDHPLAAGLELLPFLTPIAYEMAKQLLQFLWEQFQETLTDTAKAAMEQASAEFRRKVTDWISRLFQAPAPQMLTTEQISVLRDRIHRIGTNARIEPETLKTIEESILTPFEHKA
jgi:hypothetical protein